MQFKVSDDEDESSETTDAVSPGSTVGCWGNYDQGYYCLT